MRIALSLSTLLLAIGCVTARPLPGFVVLPQSVSETDPSIHWYDVSGSTRPELRARLDELGPFDIDGKRHDAYTEWFVSSHLSFVEVPEGCKVAAVSTSVRVTVTLPRWEANDESDPVLVGQWRDYLDALWVHENGHRDTGAKAAAEIEAVLPTLPARPSCADAESVAKQAASELLARHRMADRTYDEETHHGAMQGASFPASVF